MSRKPMRQESGQGTVELLLTLFAFFTIAFMYVQVGFGFGVANYIQYATFMSARAFLSAHKTEAEQRLAGQGVFEKMLVRNGKDRFQGLANSSGDGSPAGFFAGRGREVQFANANARNTAWEQGVTYKFDMKMYMMPLVRGAKRGEANRVTLVSESWLGREPSEDECLKQLTARKGKVNAKGNVLFDNGC